LVVSTEGIASLTPAHEGELKARTQHDALIHEPIEVEDRRNCGTHAGHECNRQSHHPRHRAWWRCTRCQLVTRRSEAVVLREPSKRRIATAPGSSDRGHLMFPGVESAVRSVRAAERLVTEAGSW